MKKIIKDLMKKFDELDNDPKVRKFAERHHKRIGTLTVDDLRKEFTV